MKNPTNLINHRYQANQIYQVNPINPKDQTDLLDPNEGKKPE